MKPQLTREQMEARRLLAGRLLLQGKGVTEVARLVEVAKSSVSRWKQALTQGGQEALRARRAPGARSRLAAAQQQRLLRILLRGPRKAGYATELWTCPRVAVQVIRWAAIVSAVREPETRRNFERRNPGKWDKFGTAVHRGYEKTRSRIGAR